MYLPDINVWVALTFHSHQHHTSARRWHAAAPAERIRFFCRSTQQGFLRLANNSRMFPQYALTQPQAWQQYDAYLADPRIGYAQEPPGLEPVWRQHTQLGTFSHNVWNDAYLAAFAIAGNYELVTVDQGFKQFPGLRCTILT